MSTSISINDIPNFVLVFAFKNDNFHYVESNTSALKKLELKHEELQKLLLCDIFPQAKENSLYDTALQVYSLGLDIDVEIPTQSMQRKEDWHCSKIQKLPNNNIIIYFNNLQKYISLQKNIDYVQQMAHIGHWKWDMIKNTIIWSDEVFRIFGEEPQSFKPTFASFLSYLNEEDQQKIQEVIKESIETKKPYKIEHQIIQKNGLVSYAQGSGSVEFNDLGKPISIMGSVFDISKSKESLDALKTSEEKFRKVAEVSLTGIFLYKEYYTFVNEAFCTMSGFSREELLKRHVWERIIQPDPKIIEDTAKKRLKGEEFAQNYNDIVFLHKNGQKRILRVITQTLFYDGSFGGLGTILDITDILKTEKRLKLLVQAIEQTDEMIRITDKNGINTFVNDALISHTGYTEGELIGNTNRILKSGLYDETFYKNLWETILSGKTYKNIIINKKKNSELYHEDITITPILDENNKITNFVSTSQDITTRIKMQEEFKQLAETDNLTGLSNRHQTNKELDAKITEFYRYQHNFALLMIDIDYFKRINDNFGHDVGDYVLQELSRIITKQIRQNDQFSRWGGEEFLIVLPKISLQEACEVADKIRSLIEHYSFKDIDSLTISIGVSTMQEKDTKASLLKRVDDALYAAKDKGRNQVLSL